MSIGTNDLTQYLFAADRTNAALEPYRDSLSPAVMRAIGAVIAAAVPAGVSVAVCGELAGTVDGALALVGLGVHELSMDPGSIDRVRLALSESSVGRSPDPGGGAPERSARRLRRASHGSAQSGPTSPDPARVTPPAGGRPVTDTLERVKTHQQFIDGAWVDSASGQTLAVENPANGEVIAHVQASGPEDVDRAAKAAATAFESWKNTTPQDRSLLMLKLADAIEARADEIGRVESKNAGQAGRGGDRRGPGGRRQPALLRRRGPRPRGQGRQRVPGRPHEPDPARAGRRRGLDRPVELPDHDGRLEDRAGADGRQHGRPQAVGADAADRADPGRDRRRHPAGGRAQRRDRDRAPPSATRSSPTRRSG